MACYSNHHILVIYLKVRTQLPDVWVRQQHHQTQLRGHQVQGKSLKRHIFFLFSIDYVINKYGYRNAIPNDKIKFARNAIILASFFKENIVFIFLDLPQIFFGKSILIQFFDEISMYIFGIIFLPSDHGPKSRKKLHVNQYYFYALRWLHVQQFDHILDLSSFLFERLYFSMSTTTPVIIGNIIKAN